MPMAATRLAAFTVSAAFLAGKLRAIEMARAAMLAQAGEGSTRRVRTSRASRAPDLVVLRTVAFFFRARGF